MVTGIVSISNNVFVPFLCKFFCFLGIPNILSSIKAVVCEAFEDTVGIRVKKHFSLFPQLFCPGKPLLFVLDFI